LSQSQSLRPLFFARAKKWVQRVSSKGSAGKELAILINKSPLIGVVRKFADVLNCLRRRDRLVGHPAVGTPAQREVFEQLRSQGWAKLPDDVGYPARQAIRRECEALQDQYRDAATREQGRHKTIWNYLSDLKYANAKPDESDPLVQYALSPAILNIVGSYLGETPWLRYLILTESVYQPGDITHSQKWHLDFDDARMVKLFVYLSDVLTAADGPFKLMGVDASQRVRNSFIRRHLNDSEVFSAVSENDVVDIMGPSLSSFLVDTSRTYHCGSRLMQGHSRLLYTALFTGFPSVYPGQTVDTFSASPSASELTRRVLTPLAYSRAR
jgi:hypothetical protein